MMAYIRTFFLMLAALSVVATSTVWADAASQKRSTAREAMQKQYEQEVNQAAEQIFQIAHEALKSHGTFYPFGLVIRQNDATELVAYDGDPEEAPAVEDWTEQLFVHLIREARGNKTTKMALLARLHEIEVKDKKIPGIWVQAEHRQVRPVVMFLPFITNEKGKQEAAPEQLIYYATDQSFFGHDVNSEVKESP